MAIFGLALLPLFFILTGYINLFFHPFLHLKKLRLKESSSVTNFFDLLLRGFFIFFLFVLFITTLNKIIFLSFSIHIEQWLLQQLFKHSAINYLFSVIIICCIITIYISFSLLIEKPIGYLIKQFKKTPLYQTSNLQIREIDTYFNSEQKIIKRIAVKTRNHYDTFIQFNLYSHKVYIGIILDLVDQNHQTHFGIIPFFSGYLDEKTKKLTLTTNYTKVYTSMNNTQEEKNEKEIKNFVKYMRHQDVSMMCEFDISIYQSKHFEMQNK